MYGQNQGYPYTDQYYDPSNRMYDPTQPQDLYHSQGNTGYTQTQAQTASQSPNQFYDMYGLKAKSGQTGIYNNSAYYPSIPQTQTTGYGMNEFLENSSSNGSTKPNEFPQANQGTKNYQII
jgi:hypothetical protein